MDPSISDRDLALRFDQLRQLLLCVLVTICLPNWVCAEILWRWDPSQLAARSDLVLVGHEVSATKLRVETLLKGTGIPEELQILELQHFRREYSYLTALGETHGPELSKRLVVFVSLRRGTPTIVANGVYRLTKQGAVLGYAQEENPGPYQLQVKPVYKSLEPLLEETKAAIAEIPKHHATLIKGLSEAREFSDFRSKLSELERVTCVGDKVVFEFVSQELARGRHTGYYLTFLQSIPDPSILPVMWQYYERAGDVNALTAIGRQGTPAAAVLLDQVIRHETQEEPRRFACYALMCLYEACERAGKEDECATQREMVFRLYDDVPFVVNYTTAHPRLLGVTAHPEAVVRLERNLADVKNDSSNRKYEIEHVLKACRERIRQLEMPDQNLRKNK